MIGSAPETRETSLKRGKPKLKPLGDERPLSKDKQTV